MSKKVSLVSVISYFILILYSAIGSKIMNNIGNDYQIEMIKTNSVAMMIFIFVFFTIVETTILNYAIIYYFKTTKYFENKNLLILFIASFFFGISHFSSIKFVVITFFAGIILNVNFLYYLKHTNSYWLASLSTFLVHISYNFTEYFIDINT